MDMSGILFFIFASCHPLRLTDCQLMLARLIICRLVENHKSSRLDESASIILDDTNLDG